MDGNILSRRSFLKLAGAAGGGMVLAAGLGPIVAACGGEAETTTTGAASTSSTDAASTSTVPTSGESTTTSAGAEQGRAIKVGVVAPLTGIYAAFASTLNWSMDCWKQALAEGVLAGDGKIHPIELVVADTQSDSNRAAQVTGDLIASKVDVIFSSGSPENVNPSADQCEALGCPSISTFVPWQAFFFARQKSPASPQPFKWTYTFTGGLESIVGTYLDMWSQLPTNKVVGCLWPNNNDGASWSDKMNGAPPVFEKAGYSLVVPSLYPPGSEDFTSQIADFKKAGCEICTAAVPAPDFTNFWNQAAQQGFRPKVMTVALALLFPEAARAVGDNVVGCTSELVWSPTYPYKSSLTGQTCQELAADYESKTGAQWSPAIGQYVAMEWFVAALKNTTNVDDPEAVVKAISSTKAETMWGLIDFTQPVPSAVHPVPNVCAGPVLGGQWVKGTGKWPYEIVPVSNAFAAGAPVTAKLQPIT